MSFTKIESGMIDTVDASKITGALPAIDGSALTGIDALPAVGTSGNVLTSDGSSWTSTATTAHTGNVSFPATQISSADANTLDDYEEGIWNISLLNGGTFTINSATYIKIGSIVSVNAYLAYVTPPDNTSQFLFTLPFVAKQGNELWGGSIGYTGSGNLVSWTPRTAGGTSRLYFNYVGHGGARLNNEYLAVKGNGWMAFNVSYTTV